MENYLRIETVATDRTASNSGLQQGDILESYNQMAIRSPADLDKAISTNTSTAPVIAYRDAEILTFEIPPGPLGITVVEIPFDKDYFERKRNLIVTTTHNIDGYKVVKTIDIVSAECVFGMNIFKDFFMGASDFFGGRSGTAQKILKDARVKCLQELKAEALSIGANAVIGVDLDYSEISGQGKNMLFLVATGTAVIVENSQTISAARQ